MGLEGSSGESVLGRRKKRSGSEEKLGVREEGTGQSGWKGGARGRVLGAESDGYTPRPERNNNPPCQV